MITEQEHETVPAIRGWLAATSNVEIPIGLSCEDALRRAAELLAAIAVKSLSTDHLEVDDDLKDVLWAAVEELDAKQLCQETFEECHRVYQFILALPFNSDPFGERDEILHSVAKIGWRSAPGGHEAVRRARAAIWVHWDEEQHRKACESANRLPAEIESLRSLSRPVVPEIHRICARLTKLAPTNPRLVAPAASLLYSLLDALSRQVGQLDELEFFKAVAALATGVAARQLSEWDLAGSCQQLAAACFRRCAETLDLDHVEAERLALQFARGNFHSVSQSAPKIIQQLIIPRERIKAQIVYAWSLLELNRCDEASAALQLLLREPVILDEPALHACALTLLGTAFSHLGRDIDSTASFGAAGAILARFHYPQQLALLTGSMGEHLLRQGKLEQVRVLYSAAREAYRQVGQTRFSAYMGVLLAEVLLMLGRNEQAEKELLAELSTIEKFDLRREAIAVAALLREAVARRQTDVKTIQALRDQLRKGLH
jgi:hypothetical protein